MFEWDMRYRIILVNMKMYSKKYLHILRTFAIEFRSRKSSTVMKKGMEKGEEGRKKTRHSFSSLSCIDNGTYSIRSPFQPYISQLLSALEYELTAEEMLYYALKMLSTR